MKASAFALGLCAALLLGAAGCDDVAPRVLLDLEGPRGEAEAPGPWTIAILTDGTVPRLFIAVDEDGFSTRPVTAAGAGQFVGVVPPLPVGTSIRYYAEAGGETAPAAGPRVVEIVAPRGPEPDASVGRCGLSFRAPLDGQQLREGVDDTAPQSGLQFTVIVDTDLPDGHPLRLEVETMGYADVVGVGQVGFRDVTMPTGEVRLRAHGRRDGGTCEAEITVFVSGS